MTRRSGLAPLALVVSLAAAGRAAARTGPGAPASPALSARIARLEAEVPRLMAAGEVPGVSIALIEDGRVAWTHGFGVANADNRDPVRENTVFEGASLSKPVVAYIALRLTDEGRLDLDAPLTRYVPDPFVAGDPRLEQITARRVLDHTSGLPNGRTADAIRIHFAPGERFSYSGEGYIYLQAALERITGEPLQTLAEGMVFGPMGMTNSAFVWQERLDSLMAYGHAETGEVTGRRRFPVASAASSLETTAGDYARFIAAVLGGAGLRDETRSEMMRAQVRTDSTCSVCVEQRTAPRTGADGWGLGWGVAPTAEGGTVLWHWGDNGVMKAYVAVRADGRRGVVILTNGANGHAITPDIAAAALGAPAPGFAWLRYDHYDSPGRLLLRRIVAGDAAALPDLAARQRGERPEPALEETDINSLGYRLLARKRFPDAVRVLRMNAERLPASANAHDSYGEALLAAGDTAAAVASYRRAAELGGENAAAVLARLTRPVVRVAPGILDAYTGRYDTPMGPLTVTRDADGLEGTLGTEGSARLIAISETRFSVGGNSNTVDFVRGADGRVTHAIIRAGGQEIRATRVP
ncbi:serine hydrolase [Longimicrobium terrae]|uniref:CubicO group peptidase (Beta-lactamase class C family) n=1 Tax=Longimicrobium terrae TaxID=1639882 RepID=A0A841H6J6_9BACT|nr:serine hydrolase [Longimicrobium terrae]MBB4639534.1 CubicO group peptidase (beta-lactamase class C family) [Longimicrobium terrae]MBB6073905.1 CubicO group peptidase (beta-lactamase class C family) [Longimicrobium terrae]NNC30101.1 serine hydrolase [Longimicrobium terrae]